MTWQIGLMEAIEDNEITQQEVTSLASGAINAAVNGMVIMAMMSMFVKMFYDILGPKKFAKQEEEVLGMVKEIW